MTFMLRLIAVLVWIPHLIAPTGAFQLLQRVLTFLVTLRLGGVCISLSESLFMCGRRCGRNPQSLDQFRLPVTWEEYVRRPIVLKALLEAF